MNILQDKDLRFHGICQNIIKYISILENGILTQKDSSKADGYVRNYNGCNEKQNISLAISPSLTKESNSSAFESFVADGIGFILKNLDGKIKKGVFNGEELHYGIINKDKIVGIIINSELINKKISQLDVLYGVGKGYIDDTCMNILKYIHNRGKKDINFIEFKELSKKKMEIYFDEKLESYERIDKIKEITDCMGEKVSMHLEEYFIKVMDKENIVLKDVIDFYNINKLKIFDEKGNEINEQYMFKYNLQKEISDLRSNEIKSDIGINKDILNKDIECI